MIFTRDERDGVSNHQPHDCLLKRLFRCRSKETSMLRVTGLCAGISPVTDEFPAQRISKAENVSIWWRHHVTAMMPHEYHSVPNSKLKTNKMSKLHIYQLLWAGSSSGWWIPLTITSNVESVSMSWRLIHDDVIKWKHFPRNWPFVRGIHRSRTKASDAELWCFLWSASE